MRTEYTDRLIERAERDDEFRARLLSDPKAAIGQCQWWFDLVVVHSGDAVHLLIDG